MEVMEKEIFRKIFKSKPRSKAEIIQYDKDHDISIEVKTLACRYRKEFLPKWV